MHSGFDRREEKSRNQLMRIKNWREICRFTLDIFNAKLDRTSFFVCLVYMRSAWCYLATVYLEKNLIALQLSAIKTDRMHLFVILQTEWDRIKKLEIVGSEIKKNLQKIYIANSSIIKSLGSSFLVFWEFNVVQIFYFWRALLHVYTHTHVYVCVIEI